MSRIRELQANARARRTDAADAELTLAKAMTEVVAIDHEIRLARERGDQRMISAAQRRRRTAADRQERASARLAEARTRLDQLIGTVIGGLDDGHVIAGVKRDFPLLLLPVRIETRFDEDQRLGLVLRVRIYPDDVHIDDHEPLLTKAEVDWGKAYWTAVRAGQPEANAWSGLAGRVGPYRALHLRQLLKPTNAEGDPVFAELPVRPDGTSRTPLARALPDQFVVRVRVGTKDKFVVGDPIPDTLPIGADLSGASEASDSAPLGEAVKWMSDFAAAEAAGMAVTVPLPPGTDEVEAVTVAGVCVSADTDASTDLLEELVAAHHVSHGAGFVPAGTPSNNLSDTTSGFTSRPDPARTDPASHPVAAEDSNAAVTAAALGLSRASLDPLPYSDEREDAEAKAMQAALFEACWGPYLRDHAQPGFDLKLLPSVYDFITRFLRPGGPLPALRLGRQPYGILPISPAGAKPPGEGRFVRWLSDMLPSLRRFWLAGRGEVPSGLAAYSHEAVSSRVRVRTANASLVQPLFYDLGLGGEDSGELSRRRLLAEVGIEGVLPNVVTTLFAKGQVDLWLPMAADGDTEFYLRNPKPKEANSILGLLLRNAALQVTSAAADEYRAGIATGINPQMTPYAIGRIPAVSLAGAGAFAVPTTPEFVSTTLPTMSEKMELEGRDSTGATFRIGERIDTLLGAGLTPDFERYANSDAVIAFRAALDSIRSIPTDRRARLTGEVLDGASHRYDAWVTALASKRLAAMRVGKPKGIQIGAWGYVENVRRRRLEAVVRDDLPDNTERDTANGGFVLSSSMQHANVAGVLRAAFLAHRGAGAEAIAPFAVDLKSSRIRAALDLAEGMRNGQPLGALLGYHLERQLHDRSGGDAEVDWAIYKLRERFPLKVDSGDNATAGSQRMVVNGWAVAQEIMKGTSGASELATSLRPGLSSPDRAAIEESLKALIEMIDGLADLGLAEAMHQLAGRNLDRASASTDMIGRAGLPPDRFDVAATPRGGNSIEQRLVIGFGSTSRPAGWSNSSPRANLAPEADAFVARQLGSAKTVTVRLVDEQGVEQGRCKLDRCGLAALDLAADSAAPVSTEVNPLLLARVRAECGVSGSVTIGRDPVIDGALMDVIARAAAWHRALAGKTPLGPRSVRFRADDTKDTDDGTSASIANLRARFDVDGFDPALWSMHVPASAVEAQRKSRIAAFDQAKDPVEAARALLGGDGVLTGSTGPLPADLAATLADQKALGTKDRGMLAGWLQDSGRVRATAGAVDEAMLFTELAGGPSIALRAAQSPAAPYVDGENALADKQWIGGRLSTEGALGPYPLLSLLCIGEGDASGIIGIELDAWTELVPDTYGSAAIAANLPAPDSRPPNLCLLAVPADPAVDWTREALFSVIDEALELSDCRAVDLDATRRVPAFFPTTYIADYQEPLPWRDILSQVRDFPSRYAVKGTP